MDDKVESPCLMALIWDDAIKEIQEAEERKMFAFIDARNERHEKLVALYKTYYDEAERIDRQYPHRPSRYKRNGVTPVIRGRARASEYYDRIRNLIEARKAKVAMIVTGDDEDHRHARREALQLHEQELLTWEPCRCTYCWRHV